MSFFAIVLGLILGSAAGYSAPGLLLSLKPRAFRASNSMAIGVRIGALCLLLPTAMAAFFIGVPWGGGGGELLLGHHGIVVGMFVGAVTTMFVGTFLGATVGALLGLRWGQLFGTKSEP